MNLATKVTDHDFEASLCGVLAFSDNAEFRKLLEQMKQSQADRWVLDLAGLSSVDSAGLGMFILAMELSKTRNASLVLRAPTGHVKNLIELSNMDQLIKVEA